MEKLLFPEENSSSGPVLSQEEVYNPWNRPEKFMLKLLSGAVISKIPFPNPGDLTSWARI